MLLDKQLRIAKRAVLRGGPFFIPKLSAVSAQVKGITVEVDKVGDHAIRLTTNRARFRCLKSKQTYAFGIKLVKRAHEVEMSSTWPVRATLKSKTPNTLIV